MEMEALKKLKETAVSDPATPLGIYLTGNEITVLKRYVQNLSVLLQLSIHNK